MSKRKVEMFEQLRKLAEQMAVPQRKYDWETVVEWIKTQKLVTRRMVSQRAGLKHERYAYQWLQRHVRYVVNLDEDKKYERYPDGFLIEVRKGGRVFYGHIDNFQ